MSLTAYFFALGCALLVCAEGWPIRSELVFTSGPIAVVEIDGAAYYSIEGVRLNLAKAHIVEKGEPFTQLQPVEVPEARVFLHNYNSTVIIVYRGHRLEISSNRPKVQ